MKTEPNETNPLSNAEASEALLTKRMLAAKLRRSERTVNDWIKKGHLPYMKIGRSVLFRWTTVLAHLEGEFGVLVK